MAHSLHNLTVAEAQNFQLGQGPTAHLDDTTAFQNIDGGKVVAEGDHANLLNKSDIYKNFYQKQLAKNNEINL